MSTINNKKQDPVDQYPQPPYPKQTQDMPGVEAKMNPAADHGEQSYKGSGKLTGMRAVITGGDSGIGKAVAIAFAREGADILISYLNEEEDAKDTEYWVKEAGRKAILVPGDIGTEKHCEKIIQTALDEFGGIDILVNNAAFQAVHESLQDVTAEEWDFTFKTNVYAMFYLCKAAEPHLKPGSSVINTTSVNAYTPKPILAPYTATKAAIQNFTSALAQLWAERGVRVNCVAPGPIWTPLIPGSFDEEQTAEFGNSSPIKRAGQPVEVAPAFVLLASPEASYMSGATIAVTGGKPTI
ncbi:SDR family oxidoreductase [Terrimonas sp. NA20]|uniref:SDR family oxidoreductase n=1 Tax=Terrimonas ginsenosidimutans TaxID=2908004 RepID=A0ABS9KMM1_9BACT|nr:SDR family oxidoreductase [Terrimonas ginsenosidimutans]MCG2613559.1 SDR family oxidoreductase [Terrimonas ginsenosidimutans]